MKRTDILKSILAVTLGAAVYALSIVFFYDPASIAPGGLAGIAIIISHVINFPTGTLILLLNIPLFILALLKFGKKFVFLTIYATVLSSVLMNLFEPLAARVLPLTDDMIVIAVCGAFLDALGLGIVFRAGGCTGGADILIKFLRQKYRHIRTGGMLLIFNAAVVASTFFVFGDFETTIYSALAMVTASFFLDKILYGGDSAKLVFIISDQSSEITKKIISSMQVGITLLSGEGAYSQKHKDVMLCVAKKHTFPKIRDVVKNTDPAAFIIVSSATEIFGKGYKNQYTDEL